MTFIDDDLKRLKEILKSMLRLNDAPYDPVKLKHDKVFALLARLEAAELCVDILSGIKDDENGYYYKSQMEAWRKAAGKS